MKVVKKINNNVALCVDDQNHELIAFGKGIGFPKMPYVLENLRDVERTYYGVDKSYLGLINEIPDEVFELTSRIIDYAKATLDVDLNPNLLFTLADHINFAVERSRKNMTIKSPFNYDFANLYQQEIDIAKRAVVVIEKRMKVKLPPGEVTMIAIHLVNAKVNSGDKQSYDSEELIETVVKIVESQMGITIDRDSFNFSRFATHMQYLVRRREENKEINSENLELFQLIKDGFPKTYSCANKIAQYVDTKLDWIPSDEELLYLMLHINRLCSREDCNQ